MFPLSKGSSLAWPACVIGISMSVLLGQDQVHTCTVSSSTSPAPVRGYASRKVQKLVTMGDFKITIRGISKEKETLILALTAGKLDSRTEEPSNRVKCLFSAPGFPLKYGRWGGLRGRL